MTVPFTKDQLKYIFENSNDRDIKDALFELNRIEPVCSMMTYEKKRKK